MIHQKTHIFSRNAWLIAAILACMCCNIGVQAQTDGLMSQYYEARNLYNPAIVGTTDSVRLRAGGRMQWVGIDNAPQTYALCAESPFKVGDYRIGAGAIVQSEKYGLYSSLQTAAQIAAKLKKLGGEFSFALQAGLFNQRFNGSKVFIPDDENFDSNDEGIPMRDIAGQALDIAAGVAFMHPRWYAGISCAHITNPSITLAEEGSRAQETEGIYQFEAKRTLYFMAGCNIPIKNTLFEVMPSVMLCTDFTFKTGEATLRCRYNNMFTAGIGYRYDDAVYVTIGAEIKRFFLGYSYDYSTSAISRASSGSHEVWLGYSFRLNLGDKNKYKHKSVRIM